MMKIFKKDYKYRKQVGYGLIAMYLVVPSVLRILPADYFDHGQALCLSVLFFHTQCWGCGMTRAIQHMIHLDFDTALEYNKLAFFVFPILGALWLLYFLSEVVYLFNLRKDKKNPFELLKEGKKS